MKTLTKTFARRVISALLVTIMVFSLGIVGISSASAADNDKIHNVEGAYVYFDNTLTKWQNKIWLVIGHDYVGNDNNNKFSRVYEMYNIPNTNLYEYHLQTTDNTHKWADATYYAFISTNSCWNDDGNGWGSDNLKNASGGYTAAYKSSTNEYDMTGDKLHLFTPNSSGKGTTLSIGYQEGYSNLNYPQIVTVYGAATGSTSYSANASVGTVSASGFCMNSNTSTITGSTKTTSSDYDFSYSFARGSQVTLTATPASGYKFVGWSTDGTINGIDSRTDTTYEYSVQDYNKYIYALFERDTSLSAGTLLVTPSVITLGEQLTFKTTANLTGESGNITYQLYEDGKKVNGVEVKVASGTQASITYTPTSAGQHTYFIRASYGKLEDVDTATTTITVAENLTATLELSETGTIVEGVSFGFVIGSNAGSLGDNSPTYNLFCKSESDADFVEVTNNATIIDGGVVTYTVPTAGTYQFKASVTLDNGKSTETNVVDVTVEENTPEIKLTVDHKGDVVAGTPATITATAKPNHIPYTSITYTLTSNTIQGFSMPDSTTGAFTIPANVTENLSGKHTFTVNAHAEYDGYPAVDRQVTFYITFNQPTGSDNVRVYFKSSVSWGYRPNISVNGADFVEMDTYQFLSKNSTQVAEYGWFGYNLGEVKMGDKVNITIKGNRDYFYTGTYTLDLLNETKIIPDDSGDGKAIYLALDNLNVASSSGTPMENITDSNNKHWVATATHMIIANDVSADPLAALAFAYNPVAVGDANNDGKVNVRDATLIQKDLAKITELTPLGNQVSDVNFDGKLTVKDATAIQKQIAGL